MAQTLREACVRTAAQRVRGDGLAAKGGAVPCGGAGVLGEQPGDGVGGQRRAGPGAEHRVVTAAVALTGTSEADDGSTELEL